MSKQLDKRYAYSTEDLPHTDFDKMQAIQDQTLEMCRKKDAEYGASWCRRGGVGAFFTVWRKADRLEEQLKKVEFNMFDVSDDPNSTESLDETMRDFANYLYLVIEKRKAIRERDAEIIRRSRQAGIDIEMTPEEQARLIKEFQEAERNPDGGFIHTVHAGGASVPLEMWAKAAGVDLEALKGKGLIKDPAEDECGK